jgi:hypothetical protein
MAQLYCPEIWKVEEGRRKVMHHVDRDETKHKYNQYHSHIANHCGSSAHMVHLEQPRSLKQ